MRIALVQQAAGHDKGKNVERGLEALERASGGGAELVCYAELAFERFYPQARPGGPVHDWAERVPGRTTDSFCALARDLGMVVVLNLFEREGEKCFDCSPVIDADGTLLGKTRMVHITQYEFFYEQDYYFPGDTGVPVYDTKVGKVGVSICYDRHYPEYMRALALNGAQLVIVPQAGAVGEWPEGLYEAEVQVAAFQNGYFTALCNRVGTEENLEFAGESFVCSPEGTVVARAPAGSEHILYADIDLEETERSHARKLFLRDRRPELYAGWLGKPPAVPPLEQQQ